MSGLKTLILVFPLLFLSACCSDSCECDDNCKKPYVFEFSLGAGQYQISDLDTLVVRYKFEGVRAEDTSLYFLVNNRFQPAHPCVGTLQIGLDKSIPNNTGALARVEYYKIHTAVDSFRVDGMDLTVTKSGEKCCRCVTTVERKFQIDSVPQVQNTLLPIAVPLSRKQ